MFGCIQTVGRVVIGSANFQQFDGTSASVMAGYCRMGACSLICIFVAERGAMFSMKPEANLEQMEAAL